MSRAPVESVERMLRFPADHAVQREGLAEIFEHVKPVLTSLITGAPATGLHRGLRTPGAARAVVGAAVLLKWNRQAVRRAFSACFAFVRIRTPAETFLSTGGIGVASFVLREHGDPDLHAAVLRVVYHALTATRGPECEPDTMMWFTAKLPPGTVEDIHASGFLENLTDAAERASGNREIANVSCAIIGCVAKHARLTAVQISRIARLVEGTESRDVLLNGTSALAAAATSSTAACEHMVEAGVVRFGVDILRQTFGDRTRELVTENVLTLLSVVSVAKGFGKALVASGGVDIFLDRVPETAFELERACAVLSAAYPHLEPFCMPEGILRASAFFPEHRGAHAGLCRLACTCEPSPLALAESGALDRIARIMVSNPGMTAFLMQGSALIAETVGDVAGVELDFELFDDAIDAAVLNKGASEFARTARDLYTDGKRAAAETARLVASDDALSKCTGDEFSHCVPDPYPISHISGL